MSKFAVKMAVLFLQTKKQLELLYPVSQGKTMLRNAEWEQRNQKPSAFGKCWLCTDNINTEGCNLTPLDTVCPIFVSQK